MQQDAELIRRFLAGDREAVAQIQTWIERAAWPYRPRLYEEWDDLLQDLLLEITKILQQNKFRGESSLRTYLGKVVSSTCLDRLRAKSRWRYQDVDDMLDAVDSEGLLPGSARPSFEKRDLIRKVWGQIEVECRRLWMMIVQGLSYKEMSERVGVRPGTLRVKVNRCRNKALEARKLLEENAESES